MAILYHLLTRHFGRDVAGLILSFIRCQNRIKNSDIAVKLEELEPPLDYGVHDFSKYYYCLMSNGMIDIGEVRFWKQAYSYEIFGKEISQRLEIQAELLAKKR